MSGTRRAGDESGEPEQVLPGGFVTTVVRVGDTVRRATPANADFVRDLLGHLQARGWSGAPRDLGLDERGRQILTFIEGHVAWAPAQPASIGSDQCLAAVARLVRQFHDLTAGTAITDGQEVVCHNDLSPKNTVYRDLGEGFRPVAFIDWDIAAPGPRMHDVAHVCWQYLGLGRQLCDATEAARLVRLIADEYGLADRDGLVEAILWWQDRCWRGIEAAAHAGEPAMVRLEALGVVSEVQADFQWTARHRAVLERAVNRR
ncbi:MAG TPA: phosphotransferase [Micromonosporaceae bacterium]